ncbi:hypothetical protein AAY473_024941 [Plecturocebus cupreus]
MSGDRVKMGTGSSYGFKIKCTPSKKTGYSPYEILYHRPPLILRGLPGTPRELGETELYRQLQALEKVAKKVSVVERTTDCHLDHSNHHEGCRSSHVNPSQPCKTCSTRHLGSKNKTPITPPKSP